MKTKNLIAEEQGGWTNIPLFLLSIGEKNEWSNWTISRRFLHARETYRDFIYVFEQLLSGKYLVLTLDDRRPEYIYLDLEECGYVPVDAYHTPVYNLLRSRLTKVHLKLKEEEVSIATKLKKLEEAIKQLNSKRTTRPLTDIEYLVYAKQNKDLSLHNKKDELWILDSNSNKEFHRIELTHAYMCKNLHTNKSIAFTDEDLTFYRFKDGE